jgi:hypothetical protein
MPGTNASLVDIRLLLVAYLDIEFPPKPEANEG